MKALVLVRFLCVDQYALKQSKVCMYTLLQSKLRMIVKLYKLLISVL